MGSVVGVVTGAIPTYFFGRQQVTSATQHADTATKQAADAIQHAKTATARADAYARRLAPELAQQAQVELQAAGVTL